MKFARYLEETQTPEWKKAYIDYRGLKKCITAIRRAQAQAEDGQHPLPVSPALDTEEVHTYWRHTGSGDEPMLSPQASLTDVAEEGYEPDQELEHDEGNHQKDKGEALHHQTKNVVVRAPQLSPEASPSVPGAHLSEFGSSEQPKSEDGEEILLHTDAKSAPQQRPANLIRAATLNMGFLPRLKRRGPSREFWETSKTGKPAVQWDLAKSLPLKDLLPLLNRLQKAFFDKLNTELDKVEIFYLEREKEMRARTTTLKAQLQELQDHRRLFHETYDADYSWFPPLIRRKAFPIVQNASAPNLARKRRGYRTDTDSPTQRHSVVQENKALEEEIEDQRASKLTRQTVKSEETAVPAEASPSASPSGGSGASGAEDGALNAKGWKKMRHRFDRQTTAKKLASSRELSKERPFKYDPDEYYHAKKKLKKAVLECYRGLELLENYRTLNLIGFRKALKKFEKYTKVPAQQTYFIEKIDPSAFSSGAAVQGMLSEMEQLYAARFTKGDNKLAKTRLRGLAQHKTHHFSTFRTGMLLGLAIPAFADGLYLSFQPHTRNAIPGYGGLLFVFSILLIPVLFSLLVGLNVLVWSRARINYVFIFELDLKTRLDHREYFEIPAFLLSTLCYAFWLSFSRIGTSHFSPTLWPLVWLAFVGAVLINPLPVLCKPSRYWLLKNWARLLTSGIHRVEFADFWMGDQFCSLIFSLSNLYFVVCAYSGGFDQHWAHCMAPSKWGVPFVLASLPLLARLVQSIRRWVDSKLITHLINGGKYGAGIIYYIFYFNWRHHGGARGYSFVLWCIFGTIYALYASAWDLLMDWSVLRPRAPHRLLRPELIYNNTIPLYYCAIITNVLIRFIWVLYIPQSGPSFPLRAFIAAILEMLRRWQWNVYRLENEHLGNMDQYRVTREVPLPYTFDEQAHEDDIDEDDARSVSSWRSRRKGIKAKPAHQDSQRKAENPDSMDT